MEWEEEEVRRRMRRRMKRCQKEGWGNIITRSSSAMIGQEAAGCDEFPRMEARRRRHHQPLTKLNVGEKAAPSTAHQAAADKSRQICSVLLLGIQHCSVLLSLGIQHQGLRIQHHSGSNTKGHHRPVGAGTLFNQTMGSYLQRFSFDLNTKVFCVASTCIRLPSWPPSTYFLNQVCYIRGGLELQHFCGNK